MQAYKSLIVVFFLFLSTSVFGNNAGWEKANQAYSQGKYAQALAGYQAIEKEGKVSDDLYYNLGNTYFRLKRVGESILYFERTLKLNPNHRDAKYNLVIAQSKTIDRIEAIPSFFMISWWNTLASALHPSVWGIMSLVLLFIIGMSVLGLFYSPTLRLRKWSFWLGTWSMLFCLLCIVFAIQTRADYFDDSQEIITQAVVSVKGSPDARGTSLFLLHEGTKVTRTDHVSQWKKIQTADGNEGWIEVSAATAI